MKAIIKNSRSAAQKYFFVLVTKNGKKFCHSETHVNKSQLKALIKKNLPGIEIVDQAK